MGTVDKDVNMKAIFAVMNTSWAVLKIRLEKIQACTGFNPWPLRYRCDTSSQLACQLSWKSTAKRPVVIRSKYFSIHLTEWEFQDRLCAKIKQINTIQDCVLLSIDYFFVSKISKIPWARSKSILSHPLFPVPPQPLLRETHTIGISTEITTFLNKPSFSESST